MANDIKCPKCGHSFTLDEAMSDELNVQLAAEKEKLRNELSKWKKEQEDKLLLQKEAIEDQAAKKAVEETSVKLKALEAESIHKSQQVQDLQKKELELLRVKSALEEKQKDAEMDFEKRFLEKRKEIEDSTIKREQELFDLKTREFKIQMEQQQKLIEELKRKSEQGSMQLQGETQELLLEEILREAFPFDMIEEVGKGVEGADSIQTVRNTQGHPCGKIIYESKRTKQWNNSWLDKLKSDKRNTGADLAILVTQTFPKDMDRFGEKEGIWICNFSEVSSVALLLRSSLINIHSVQLAQEGKGDKMQMLYDYLTGKEFRGQMEAIVEGFLAMKLSISKERIQMEKIWKEREKQLEKVLQSSSGLYGSVKGIAGASVIDIPLLEGTNDETELLED